MIYLPQIGNPLSGVNISKAQNDTSNLIEQLVNADSISAIKQILNTEAGSFAGAAFSFLDDKSIEGLVIPLVKNEIEKLVLSNSRMENIRVWFNNKGW